MSSMQSEKIAWQIIKKTLLLAENRTWQGQWAIGKWESIDHLD